MAYRAHVVRAAVSMDTNWRPKTVDPLGKAFGTPKKAERRHKLWLDLRSNEITFAQQVLVQLFYAVRRVVDEAGRALPSGATVEGLLFDELRYERADTIGSSAPIFLDTGGATSLVNATTKDGREEVVAVLRAPTTSEELAAAQAELESSDDDALAIIALPPVPMLWAQALTGLDPGQLECLEGNEGA